MSTSSDKKQEGVWSESATQLAQQLTVSQREKLLAEEGVREPREIRILAEVLDPAQPETWMRENMEPNESDEILAVIVTAILVQKLCKFYVWH